MGEASSYSTGLVMVGSGTVCSTGSGNYVESDKKAAGSPGKRACIGALDRFPSMENDDGFNTRKSGVSTRPHRIYERVLSRKRTHSRRNHHPSRLMGSFISR